MKKFIFVLLLFIVTSILGRPEAKAQCAMCTINAEQGSKGGNTQTKGINNGVLYLLGMPFVLVAAIGGLWYFKFYKNGSAAQ